MINLSTFMMPFVAALIYYHHHCLYRVHWFSLVKVFTTTGRQNKKTKCVYIYKKEAK